MYLLNVNEPRRKTTAFAYVKFFSEREHAEHFLDGDLFMRRLAYFRRVEDEEGRWDSTEGTWAWLQKQGLEILLTVPGVGITTMTERDFAAPVSMALSQTDDLYVFCMYSYYIQEPLPTDDLREVYGDDRLAELEAALQIDPKCLRFGSHAVFVHAGPFMQRLKAATVDQSLRLRADYVRYYDDEVLNGQFDLKDVPFRKQKRFDYQREFRISVRTLDSTPGPRTFNVGSLRGLGTYIPAESLLNALKLSPRNSSAS